MGQSRADTAQETYELEQAGGQGGPSAAPETPAANPNAANFSTQEGIYGPTGPSDKKWKRKEEPALPPQEARPAGGPQTEACFKGRCDPCPGPSDRAQEASRG